MGYERYYYDTGDRKYPVYGKPDVTFFFDNTKNRYVVDSAVDQREEQNIRNKNKQYNFNGVQRSTICPTTSAKNGEGRKKIQSVNMLITKISTDTPTRKPVNIDSIITEEIGSVVANSAMSFSSGLSDEKGSEHIHTNKRVRVAISR